MQDETTRIIIGATYLRSSYRRDDASGKNRLVRSLVTLQEVVHLQSGPYVVFVEQISGKIFEISFMMFHMEFALVVNDTRSLSYDGVYTYRGQMAAILEDHRNDAPIPLEDTLFQTRGHEVTLCRMVDVLLEDEDLPTPVLSCDLVEGHDVQLDEEDEGDPFEETAYEQQLNLRIRTEFNQLNHVHYVQA
jgi:hypothetical protein